MAAVSSGISLSMKALSNLLATSYILFLKGIINAIPKLITDQTFGHQLHLKYINKYKSKTLSKWKKATFTLSV